MSLLELETKMVTLDMNDAVSQLCKEATALGAASDERYGFEGEMR